MLAYLGINHRPLLLSGDPTEIAVEQAIADAAQKWRREDSERRDHNLAIDISNGVGRIVGRALSDALSSIARAMSG